MGTRWSLIIGITTLMIAGSLMLVLRNQSSALAFMLPVFLSSIGFAWILGAAAGKALAPFGDKAGTAAALLGLFQMSGSGLLVGTLQRIMPEPQLLIGLTMWLAAPALLILFSPLGFRWHASVSEC
ncbi:multidrug resistance protein, putative [Vibrio cholerae]|nr:multidrug resistance protein, putative [Vibrio cholerae]